MSAATAIDQLPLTALVPETAAEPVVIYDQHAALRIGIVERSAVSSLPNEWDAPGNYILLDTHDETGGYGVYVGKAAPGGVRSRLKEHLKKKAHWTRSVIIRRDTTFGLNSAQVGWLEGRLWDLMDAAEDANLQNNQRPQDETLAAYDRKMLEQAVLPIQRILRLIGYETAPADEDEGAVSTIKPTTTGRAHYKTTLAEVIQSGHFPVGSRLVSTNGLWPATAEVVADGIEFAGTVYKKPSAAGSAVKNGGSANGWDFWAVDTENGQVKLSTIRSRCLKEQGK